MTVDSPAAARVWHAADIPFVGNPETPALDDAVVEMDRAGFRAAVDRAAVVLTDHGVARGSVVALLLPNRAESVVVMFAAWHLGAATTPVNPSLTPSEVQHQIDDSGAVVVVSDPETAEAAGLTVPLVDVSVIADDTTPITAVPGAERCLDDLALLVYTSGTTGRPKGVMLDHANVMAMTRLLVTALEVSPRDRALLVLPLFHVNAIMASCLVPLYAGASTVVLPKFDRSTFWASVARHRPTFFSGVPAMFHLLLASHESAPDTSHLRFVVCGAAPMPAAAITAFEERFAVPVLQGYGLSETTVACNISPLRGERIAGTVGPSLPGIDVRTVDDDGTQVPVGEPGEIVVRGPIVMRGYLGRPEATAEVIHDGWLHTGDIGMLDDDGVLTVVDRKKDMIIRGGENIYPKEIEDVLAAHSSVLEVAVVGASDPIMGEIPVAFVTLRPDAAVTESELLEHAREALAAYKVPTAVHFETSLPRNSVGKITKGALRDRLAATGWAS